MELNLNNLGHVIGLLSDGQSVVLIHEQDPDQIEVATISMTAYKVLEKLITSENLKCLAS